MLCRGFGCNYFRHGSVGNEGGSGLTLQVARLQEERVADALEQSIRKSSIIKEHTKTMAQLREGLVEIENESNRWKKYYAQEIVKRREILRLSRELVMTLHPKDSQIPTEKLIEWVDELQSTKRREIAKLIVEACREQNQAGGSELPITTIIKESFATEK